MTKKAASGAVLPPGTVPAHSSLDAGRHTVTIRSAEPVGSDPNDGVYATCVYPDGWVKDHQVMPDDVAGLCEKIVAQLRGRYGAGEVKLIQAPGAVSAGATVTVEV